MVQTEASRRFVGSASFEAITGAPVLGDEFEPDPLRGAYPGEPAPERTPISHLALVERADLYLIAPATANTIAKLAHGHADNLVTTAALAAPCPVVVAPAMNNRMYEHPATRANLELLTARRDHRHPPGEGDPGLARRARGRAAWPSPPTCWPPASRCSATPVSRPRRRLAGRPRTGHRRRHPRADRQRRFIGNRSSGRMGFALARQAARRGAEVDAGGRQRRRSSPRRSVDLIVTVTDRRRARGGVRQEHFETADVAVSMAAAVADFRLARSRRHQG